MQAFTETAGLAGYQAAKKAETDDLYTELDEFAEKKQKQYVSIKAYPMNTHSLFCCMDAFIETTDLAEHQAAKTAEKDELYTELDGLLNITKSSTASAGHCHQY